MFNGSADWQLYLRTGYKSDKYKVKTISASKDIAKSHDQYLKKMKNKIRECG